MSNLTFLGHGSLKFTTTANRAIYVDPFFKGDYSQGADALLVTHHHGDHNRVDLVSIGANCLIVLPEDALEGGIHHTFERDWLKVTAVTAANKNHNPKECVGYVLEFDGLKIYCGGDTSTTPEMGTTLAAMKLDYAFLPIDGIYNMGPVEASACGKLLKATTIFPIHNNPQSVETGQFYDTGFSEMDCPNMVILKPGQVYPL